MRHKSAAYVTWGILMALSLPAYAAEVQDTDQGVMTKDVVVTATRTEAEVKTVPQTVEVITAEDIEKLGATDVYSALRLADNIQIMIPAPASVTAFPCAAWPATVPLS